MPATIKNVLEDTIAFELEIEKGDKLLKINNKDIKDILDYQFLSANEEIIIRIEKKNGEIIDFEIEKDEDEDLGMEFNGVVFDKVRVCRNNCIFCFIDQNHPNSRKIVRCKDDDFRLSFIYGNFITLNNLSEADFKKIVDYRLSPLYISVQATSDEVRQRMLRYKMDFNLINYLRRFAENNIQMHIQIVLCPDVNDSIVLENSLNDLMEFNDHILSIGIVPVGLTQFRDTLYKLNKIDKQKAIETINIVKTIQQKYRSRFGQNRVYLSDEFYFTADKPLPSLEHYNEMYQYENGIGMARNFIEEFKEASENINFDIKKKTAIITSLLGYKTLNKVLKGKENLDIIKIENNYFGKEVSVTGLLCFEDISNEISKIKNSYERVVISKIVLNDKNYFIDDYYIDDLIKLHDDIEIRFCENNAESLLNTLMDG